MIVSLEEMKEYLGISDTSQDIFLQTELDVITDAIEAYCRRKFSLTLYTQTFYADQVLLGPTLSLYTFPVKEVLFVQSGNGTIWDDFRLNKSAGVITRRDGFYSSDYVVVQYKAGYDLIPPTVRSVVFSLVQQRYNKKSSGVDLNFGNDVQRVSIPGAISVDFDYSLSNNDRSTPFGMILGSYLNILDHYRSERAVIPEGSLTYVELT